jgi:hypothetical protein
MYLSDERIMLMVARLLESALLERLLVFVEEVDRCGGDKRGGRKRCGGEIQVNLYKPLLFLLLNSVNVTASLND